MIDGRNDTIRCDVCVARCGNRAGCGSAEPADTFDRSSRDGRGTSGRRVMLYYFGMVMAAVGATVLIGALTYVTTMLGVVITAMLAFTAAPVLDRVFKEKA